MTKRVAIRRAHEWAAAFLREAVVSGHDLLTKDENGEPRSKADQERVLWACEQVALRNDRRSR